ncbi:shikimate dehydrogenase [Thiohalobacter sp. IOR34]|uniref:shikimate dehydrogenase n=1 Tax=Thiohalobacter sp. IOR34 TaxID=3057176 RepID=UPI0025B194EE|nr:shikimate dehydrogenase [Thiohalobacter sp. IOR34]WJW75605.1 shikimate dehydrogenase [Thiohalobacter sp. IOR34]
MTLDRYAVMGNPIAHSLSPRIHRLFAEQTGEAIRYEAICVEPGRFAEAVAEFRAAGGQGLNVTVPFKQEAWALAERRSERAERAGAVNTLYWDPEDRLCGDNTDGIGLVRDLTRNLDLQLAGSRILLIGAGGAARGVLAPLLEQAPAELLIANRTAARALELEAHFRDLGPVRGCALDAIPRRPFDLLINATAAGLSGEVPPIPAETVKAESCCYDMMYGREPTAFVRWAVAQGAGCARDGLGMLVEQAAESFHIWRGVRPDTAPVIEALRKGD